MNTFNVKSVTDGAIVDFGDLNGDCSLDIIFGGTNSGDHLYVAYASGGRTCG